MITNTEDDYLDCREYHDRIGETSIMHPDFISFQHPDGNHYFAWVHDGEVILRSEAYPDFDKMERGLLSVLRNRELPERYSVEERDGRHFLLLWGGGEHEPHTGHRDEHSEIGRSCPKPTWRALHALLLSRGKEFADRVVPLGAGAGRPGTAGAAGAAGAAAIAPVLAAMANPPPRHEPVVSPKPTVRATPPPVREPVGAVAGRDEGTPGWWQWVLPLLALGLLFLGFKNCQDNSTPRVAKETQIPPAIREEPVPPPVTERMPEPAPPPAASATRAVTPTPPMAVVPQRMESIKVMLPGGLALEAYKGGIEDRLVKYLSNPTPGFDAASETANWYDFDNINFDFDKATITSESMVQIRNLANILKAFPGVKISVGGYTDRKGDDQLNLELSQARSEAVLEALREEGASADQLVDATGYGETFAKVPESASDEERRADRRTSVRILSLPGKVASGAPRTIKVTLPGGVFLDAYHGGIEDKLIAVLTDPALPFDPDSETGNWYDFDNINFDFEKASITADSMVQIDNLAGILKAFPKVRILVGGYTDRKGDDQLNLELSQARADSVLAALRGRGVGDGQLGGAEGYGEKYATVPEDATDEARRADRRTSVRILAR